MSSVSVIQVSVSLLCNHNGSIMKHLLTCVSSNIGKSLGKGTFGKVKQATHTLTGEKVAVKILEKDKIKDKKDVERITREIKILKKVRHPNVIQLYEVAHFLLFKFFLRSLKLKASYS
jgi:serine/threonine protein kinase